nr:immunoglobulin heavy chain junction region [Macaca mulatta]
CARGGSYNRDWYFNLW